jgi:hypothetical protein
LDEDGNRWMLFTKTEPIFWEAEDSDQELGTSLPDLRKFPQSGASRR